LPLLQEAMALMNQVEASLSAAAGMMPGGSSGWTLGGSSNLDAATRLRNSAKAQAGARQTTRLHRSLTCP
jgi:hypothetical protein